MGAAVFNKDQILRFRTLIKSRWGISIAESKDYLVESKLRKALETTGFASPEELVAHRDEATLQKVAQAVTTNHTFFFRESEHFDILVRDAARRPRSEPLIWCAAASSGEECYSLAIRLLEAGIDRFRLLASDIDRQMLASVNQGCYPDIRLHQVPPDLRQRYFVDLGTDRGTHWFQVRDELRDRLAIKALNLLEDHVFAEPFDYILCRNVLIYFDHPTQGKVVDSLTRNLRPGGLLFLGHSESLMTIPHTSSFTQVDASVYRKGH